MTSRISTASLLIACALLTFTSPAVAADCNGSPRALGVSRVVQIDTASGPRFGRQQYKDVDFLRDGEVVLTFDDGPLRHNTRKVLDALAQHCTRGTFFLVGRMAASDPQMVREIIQRGHTVGSHTWSHRNLRAMSSEAAQKEIELGISAIRIAAGGPISPFFRFPYLSDSARTMHHLRLRDVGMFSIDVDALDYRTSSPHTVIDRVMRGLKAQKKGIVLFHDIQSSTARALMSLLDQLAANNFRIVHLVPKSEVKTIAKYDAMAEQEFSRRKMVLAANPLAARALTWPVSSGTPMTRIAPTAGDVVPPAPTMREVVPAAERTAPQPDVRQASAASSPSPAVAPAPRARRIGAEPSWQSRAFGSTY